MLSRFLRSIIVSVLVIVLQNNVIFSLFLQWGGSRSKDSNAMGKDGEKEPKRMSLSELPPIIPRPGTGSCKSRQSSGSNSAGNGATQISKGYPMKYSERPSLISAEDSGIVINGSESGRFTTGRSQVISPGSGTDDSGEETKAASFNGTNNSASDNVRPAMRSRSKTWGADGQAMRKSGSANKLHTLYERNGSKYVRQISTSSESAKNNKELKLPTAVIGGHSSSKSSYNSFDLGKRTQSYSNLSSSKYSESSKTNNNNSRVPNRNVSHAKTNTNLHKVRSDQNIYYKSTIGSHGDHKSNGRSTMVSQSGRKTRMNNVSNHSFQNSMLHSKSQPNIQETLSSSNTKTRATTSKMYRKKYSIEDDGKISQSLVRYNATGIFGEANEKDKRIIDWLREIENEAERPESPEIEDDQPQQTDTAIHVVYGQD